MRLILASASPRRADLLRAAGFDFDTVVADVDEAVRAGEPPARYVRRLAAEKSFAALKLGPSSRFDKLRTGVEGCATYDQSVPQGFSPAIILAADTAVVVDGNILGKPRDDADAAAMLERLSGRRHDVLTGVSIRRNAFEVGRVETTAVFFAVLTPHEVAWYVESGEGRDKAGGYAIQGLASRFVTRIEGSYANVVGLPVAAVVELLTEAGFFQEELRKSRT
jgi:nucleoside triphosphate pyrophosphatase